MLRFLPTVTGIIQTEFEIYRTILAWLNYRIKQAKNIMIKMNGNDYRVDLLYTTYQTALLIDWKLIASINQDKSYPLLTEPYYRKASRLKGEVYKKNIGIHYPYPWYAINTYEYLNNINDDANLLPLLILSNYCILLLQHNHLCFIDS